MAYAQGDHEDRPYERGMIMWKTITTYIGLLYMAVALGVAVAHWFSAAALLGLVGLALIVAAYDLAGLSTRITRELERLKPHPAHKQLRAPNGHFISRKNPRPE